MIFFLFQQQQSPSQEIHVKLDDDIREKMAKGQRERSRMRDAFLGFPASLDPDPVSTVPSSQVTTQITEQPTDSYHDLIVEPERKILHPKQPRTWEEISPLDDISITTFR